MTSPTSTIISRLSRLTTVLGITFLAACGEQTTPENRVQTEADLPPIVRLVTGTNADGIGTMLYDYTPTEAVPLNGSTITRLWETGPVPTSYTITEDKAKVAGNAYRDGFGGTNLYMADIPPGSSLEDIPMHRQESLDYVAILSGEIYLILEDREVLMKPGDILVQGGNLHSWENRSNQYTRMLVVVLTASE